MACKVPVQTSYPRGGVSEGSAFVDQISGAPLRIYLDSTLPDHLDLCKILTSLGGEITAAGDNDTHLFVLDPSSRQMINTVCHPAWLPSPAKDRLIAAIERGDGEGDSRESWKKNVILSSAWIRKCHETGRFIGEEQEWSGMRQAGPPVDTQLFNIWEFGTDDNHHAASWTCADCHRQCLDRWDLEFHLSKSSCEPKAMHTAAQRPAAQRPAAPRWRFMPELSPEPLPPPVPSAIVLQPPTSPVQPDQEDELMDDDDIKPGPGPIPSSQQSEDMDIDTPTASQVPQQSALQPTRTYQLDEDMDIETPTPIPTPRRVTPPAPPALATTSAREAGIDLSTIPSLSNLSSMFPFLLDVNVWFYSEFSQQTQTVVSDAIKAVGGIITTGDDWGHATHLLFPEDTDEFLNETFMDSLAEACAVEGKWCVDIEWIVQCLKAKEHIPEGNFAVTRHRPRGVGGVVSEQSHASLAPADTPRRAARPSEKGKEVASSTPTNPSPTLQWTASATGKPSLQWTSSATGANSTPVLQIHRPSATGSNTAPVSQVGPKGVTSTPTAQMETRRTDAVTSTPPTGSKIKITGANLIPVKLKKPHNATGSNANQTPSSGSGTATAINSVPGAKLSKKQRKKQRQKLATAALAAAVRSPQMSYSDYSRYGPWTPFHLSDIIGSEKPKLSHSGEPCQYLAKKYGLSADEWKDLLEQWEEKTGPFSGFKYKVPSETEVKICRIPPVVIALVASHYHDPNGRKPPEEHANAAKHLAKLHPEYTEMEWGQALMMWRHRTGMFDPKTGLRPFDITSNDEEEIFSCRSARVTAQAPSLGRRVNPHKDINSGESSSSGIITSSSSARSTPFTSGSVSPSNNGSEASYQPHTSPVVPATHDSPASSDNNITSGSGGWAKVPARVQVEPSPAVVPTKRPSSGEEPNLAVPKRVNLYSPFDGEERRLMAAYMMSRLPTPTGSSPNDWADFAKINPHRPAQAWAQHFRATEGVIRSLLKKMLAAGGSATPAQAPTPVPTAPPAPHAEGAPVPPRVTRALAASATPPVLATPPVVATSAPTRRSTRSTLQPNASSSQPLPSPKRGTTPKPRPTASQPPPAPQPTPRRGRSAAEAIVIDDDDSGTRRRTRRTRGDINNPVIID